MPGCMATAGMLAVLPLVNADLLSAEMTVSALTGSSGSGSAAGPQNQHAERSGAMRVFAPSGHRHSAEIAQFSGVPVRMMATAVEAVRGVQVACIAKLSGVVTPAAVHALYRDAFRDEPFVRVVNERRGAHRMPEPKFLSGTNICDVGIVVSEDGEHVTAVSALDNLGKGGAAAAIQCLNVRQGFPEGLGLSFPGLHPI